eukprot:SAG11_NODE_382_length_9923_cov_29.276771_1_plen_96_part_00
MYTSVPVPGVPVLYRYLRYRYACIMTGVLCAVHCGPQHWVRHMSRAEADTALNFHLGDYIPVQYKHNLFYKLVDLKITIFEGTEVLMIRRVSDTY